MFMIRSHVQSQPLKQHLLNMIADAQQMQLYCSKCCSIDAAAWHQCNAAACLPPPGASGSPAVMAAHSPRKRDAGALLYTGLHLHLQALLHQWQADSTEGVQRGHDND
jgi:hypothetical protein